MQDQSARYAIALEGDWGTGKTRFCETVLADKLYPLGYDVLRISLFGVTSTEEVYGRLTMSMLRLASDEDDNRVQRFFKGLAAKGAQTAIAYSTHKLSEIGVSIEASPQMLTGILGKKQLLVLDDVERLGMDEAFRNEFFGVVNNLVEVQDCKVMFVTNHYDSIPADIREKLVWKCYRFEPSPEELVEAIVLPIVLEAERKPEFDVPRSLTRAANAAASCRNARAMIKSTELPTEAIACEAVSDKQIDAANRERALREFSRFTFLAAMDEAPTDQFYEGDDKEVRAERIIQRAEYSTYQQLWVIKAFFGPRVGVKEGDVGVCLKDFIKSTYGGSPETMALNVFLIA